MAPSDGEAQDAVNGASYDGRGSMPKNGGTFLSNGSQENMQRYAAESSSQERSQQRQLDPNGDGETRSRPKKDRRPSDKQRICGKCQKQLTGQFVRALGDTYHLECFTCHVREICSQIPV
jgi:hypothetical protein